MTERPRKTKEQIAFGKLYPSPRAFEDAIARRMLERKAETMALFDGKSEAERQRIFLDAFHRAMAEVIAEAKATRQRPSLAAF
jgi:hypothetical protein